MNKLSPAQELAKAKLMSRVVVRGECWVWLGGTSHGYGAMRVEGKQVYTHRLSWTLHRGPIPDGMEACHKCDVGLSPGDFSYRRCCNPDHLFIGTHAQNHEDKVLKGRHPAGDRHGFAKSDKALSANAIIMLELGARQVDVAEWLGVRQTTVSQIHLRQHWSVRAEPEKAV